jgi:hypothetical protein
MKNPLLLHLLVVFAFGDKAPDFSTLYPADSLTKWRVKYEDDWNWNFRNQLVPLLTEQEKAAIGDLRIVVPAIGPQKGVFEFFSHDHVVELPALSMKFFRDLATASAWLAANDYNLETIQQYVGMIHVKTADQFPGMKIPLPLIALGIPAGALENAVVKDLFDKTFKSGMLFILCHELGHVRYGHQGYDIPLERARQNEAQADRFALEIMRRLGLVPAGITFWFMNSALLERGRSDFNNDEQWMEYLRTKGTHPLTASRLQALAQSIQKGADDFAVTAPDPEREKAFVLSVASDIKDLGAMFGKDGIRILYRQQARSTELKMLVPRRGVAYQADQGVRNIPAVLPFEGIFDCKFSLLSTGNAFDLTLVLKRNGEMVSGDYGYGAGVGRIQGTVKENMLYLNWFEGQSQGLALMKWNRDGAGFTGTWGNGESSRDAGGWDGRRRPGQSPN